MTSFHAVAPPVACGRCNERRRPKSVNWTHSNYLGMLYGYWFECPDCQNAFKVHAAEESGMEYVRTDWKPVEASFRLSLIGRTMELSTRTKLTGCRR